MSRLQHSRSDDRFSSFQRLPNHVRRPKKTFVSSQAEIVHTGSADVAHSRLRYLPGRGSGTPVGCHHPLGPLAVFVFLIWIVVPISLKLRQWHSPNPDIEAIDVLSEETPEAFAAAYHRAEPLMQDIVFGSPAVSES